MLVRKEAEHQGPMAAERGSEILVDGRRVEGYH